MSKSDCSIILTELAEDIGVPQELIADFAEEMHGCNTDWMKEIRRFKIKMRWTELGRKNQNKHAQLEIGELKKHLRRRMLAKREPKRLWDYGLVYEAKILSRISRGPGLRPGLETVTGRSVDISKYTDFEFYDLVWYYPGGSRKLDMTEEGQLLGCWLGVSHRVGSDMCFWILTASGKVISESTAQHVTRKENPQGVEQPGLCKDN
jgi:hypothetical protein